MPTADPASGNTDAAPLEPEIPPEPVIPQPAPDPSDVPRKFDDGRVPFSVRFHGVDVAYETIAAFVMPGEVFEFEAKRGSGDFDANADEGPVIATGKSAWRWTAPAKPGEYEIGLRDKEGKWLSDEITIRMFVMTPYDGGPAIGDYSIGTYEKKPHRDDPVYLAPKGFVEVNDRNDDTEISPHFTLGQFRNLAKGREYIALKTSLVVKLERLLEELARRGMPAKTLQVVSGFRTPAYNANIGNESKWSRHLYGDAADVVLDRDEDGFQDDMDGDSLSTVEDARKLLEVVEHIEKRPDPPALGGLAPYRANPQHGPFLHVDTRGKPARW